MSARTMKESAQGFTLQELTDMALEAVRQIGTTRTAEDAMEAQVAANHMVKLLTTKVCLIHHFSREAK